MDALAGLLDGPRARGAFLLRTRMRAPWCVRVEDEAPLSVVAAVRGEAWVVPDDGAAVLLAPGDVVICRGPDHYTFTSQVGAEVQAVIEPGQECRTPAGQPLRHAMDLGTRTWGNDPDGDADHLIGTYQLDTSVSRRLLDALPPLLVVRGDQLRSPLIGLLEHEIGRDEPGQDAVLDRLLDLLLIATLRAWFDRRDAEEPGWYRAHGDPVVGQALRMLQHHPAQRWTVATLAAAVGVSRAVLARRFSELVGEPPMSFLTQWRLALAADLLLEPGATVGGVAAQVGYGSPYSLSTAFKRWRGISPRDHRLAVTA